MIGHIGIVGGGAWGTALATVARRAGRSVTLQAREPEVVEAINSRGENPLFLPGITLDGGIRATLDPAEAVGADLILLVVPAQYLRSILASCADQIPPGTPLVICAKGIEGETGALMGQVVAETVPQARLAILSGPSFAIEVARGLPAAVTFACADADLRASVPAALSTPRFRIYSTDDVVGAQVGSAVKNVLAIGCGIVAGRGLGENARAALINRGLVEMVRLAVALGGRGETLMGLSGLGDLVLTCTAMQSRNYSLGAALGGGTPLTEILAGRRAVTEGVATAASVGALARRLGVQMPICAAVDAILNQGADIDATIDALLARPLKEEAPFGPSHTA